MARERILRTKITVVIPYNDLKDGYAAQKALEAAKGKAWQELIDHAGAEFTFGDIDDTSRDVPVPKTTPTDSEQK